MSQIQDTAYEENISKVEDIIQRYFSARGGLKLWDEKLEKKKEEIKDIEEKMTEYSSSNFFKSFFPWTKERSEYNNLKNVLHAKEEALENTSTLQSEYRRKIDRIRQDYLQNMLIYPLNDVDAFARSSGLKIEPVNLTRADKGVAIEKNSYGKRFLHWNRQPILYEMMEKRAMGILTNKANIKSGVFSSYTEVYYGEPFKLTEE